MNDETQKNEKNEDVGDLKGTPMSPDRLFLDQQLKSFGPHTLAVGIILVILGSVGVILPAFMSFATVGFIAGLLILGGTFWGYHTYQAHQGDFLDWLKPLLLILFGILLLVYPLPGVASLALLLSLYLFIDAYGSFGLARSRYPGKGWGWMLFNGLADLALAILFLIGWPKSSVLFVGIFVGISLIFDGWALIMIGWAMRHGGDTGQGGQTHGQ